MYQVWQIHLTTYRVSQKKVSFKIQLLELPCVDHTFNGRSSSSSSSRSQRGSHGLSAYGRLLTPTDEQGDSRSWILKETFFWDTLYILYNLYNLHNLYNLQEKRKIESEPGASPLTPVCRARWSWPPPSELLSLPHSFDWSFQVHLYFVDLAGRVRRASSLWEGRSRRQNWTLKTCSVPSLPFDKYIDYNKKILISEAAVCFVVWRI